MNEGSSSNISKLAFFLGFIASVITIFVFLSGKEDFSSLFIHDNEINSTKQIKDSVKTQKTPTVISILPTLTVFPTETEVPLVFRDHFQVDIGTGIFTEVSFSDGLSEYSSEWLSNNNHFRIQRIILPDYPDGCAVARYDSEYIWLTGSNGMKLLVNDEIIGVYQTVADRHGYILEYSIGMGDNICVEDFTSSGFAIFIGPDTLLHYDSYCYREDC